MGAVFWDKKFTLNNQAQECLIGSVGMALVIYLALAAGFNLPGKVIWGGLVINAILYHLVLNGNRKSYRSVLVINVLFFFIYRLATFNSPLFALKKFVFLLLSTIISTHLAYFCYISLEKNGLVRYEQITLG